MRRARQRQVRYTLNPTVTRQQAREFEQNRPTTKVGVVFDYIRSVFDDFVTRRVHDRVNYILRANPTVFVPLDYNVENSQLRQAIRENYPYITDAEMEEWGEWTVDDNQQLWQALQVYVNDLYNLIYRDVRFEGVFAPPSFAYRVENRTHRVRLDRLDALVGQEWVDLTDFQERYDNFHDMGSDVATPEQAEQMVNAFQMATEVGLILPFINHREREALPKLKHRPFLSTVVYRTRRSGAFFPYLLKPEYQFFYQWFKLAQISFDPNDQIYHEHCLLYALRQTEMNQDDKQRLIQGLLEYTIEFKDNVKTKCKVTFATLNQIFTTLNMPYNLFLRALNSEGRFEYVAKFARINNRNDAWRDIHLLFDEEHYMVDFPLPFTSFFARNFIDICNYNYQHNIRYSDNKQIEDYFTCQQYRHHIPCHRRDKPVRVIWFSELFVIAKTLGWFVAMDEHYHNRLLTLPLLPQDEKILPQSCNAMNEQIKRSNPAYNKRYDKIVYFDFEALPDKKRHIPFLIVVLEADYRGDEFPVINYNGRLCGDGSDGFINYNGDRYHYFHGWNCVEQFFEYLGRLKPIGFENTLTREQREISPFFNVLCYAHNLMYDGRFLRGHYFESYIEKGNRCYMQMHRLPNNVLVTFKDFLALTNTALKKLPKWYPYYFEALNLKKEIYFYDIIQFYVNANGTGHNLYTPLFVRHEMSDHINMLRHLGHSEEEIQEFLITYKEVMNIPYDQEPSFFDFLEYTKFYCLQDVRVLKVCHQLFRHEVKHSILDVNIDYFLTSPSLAKYWFEREIFMPIKWIFKVNSTLQEFILKACHGGRCMTARNRKYHVEADILNIDAVSLYPSAMSIMYIPKGKPTVIPDDVLHSEMVWDPQHPHPLFSYLFKPNQVFCSANRYCSHFVVEIEIVEVQIYRDFPTIVRKEKDGKHNTNTNGFVYCDNVMLEDMIMFHGIKYRVLRGVWWVAYHVIDRTGNTKLFKASRDYSIRDKVKELFELRKQMKRDKNPQEKIIKLLLNSGFGSMMQKPIKYELNVCNTEGMEEILLNNSCYLKEYERILNEHFEETDVYVAKMLADTNRHYNLAFLASLVLSFSKRLMNTLMYALEDFHVPIYYTDTDSIHVNRTEFLDKIEVIERGLGVHKGLIGTDLCQFHNDYDGYGLGIYDDLHQDPGDAYDLYACEGYYLSKKIYAERVRSLRYPDREGIFYRLKGVPENCIKDIAQDLFDGDVMRVYEALYNDHGIVFDIAKTKTVFRFNTDYIYNLSDFTRTIKCCYSKLDPNELTIHNFDGIPTASEYCMIEKNSIDIIIANSMEQIGLYPPHYDFEPDEGLEMDDERMEIYRSMHSYDIRITEVDDIYQRENEDIDHTADNLSDCENAPETAEEDIEVYNHDDDTAWLDDIFSGNEDGAF